MKRMRSRGAVHHGAGDGVAGGGGRRGSRSRRTSCVFIQGWWHSERDPGNMKVTKLREGFLITQLGNELHFRHFQRGVRVLI